MKSRNTAPLLNRFFESIVCAIVAAAFFAGCSRNEQPTRKLPSTGDARTTQANRLKAEDILRPVPELIRGEWKADPIFSKDFLPQLSVDVSSSGQLKGTLNFPCEQPQSHLSIIQNKSGWSNETSHWMVYTDGKYIVRLRPGPAGKLLTRFKWVKNGVSKELFVLMTRGESISCPPS